MYSLRNIAVDKVIDSVDVIDLLYTLFRQSELLPEISKKTPLCMYEFAIQHAFRLRAFEEFMFF